MQSHFVDERTGISYTLRGNYYFPDVVSLETGYEIGRFGRELQRYLKEHKRLVYLELLSSCGLNAYLHGVDVQAQERLDVLGKQMADQENVTETLKAENQLLWVQKMNNIWNRALEIVNSAIIYY